MKILGLDQSSFTGFCHGEPGGTPTFGVFRMPKIERGPRLIALESFVINMVKANAIDLVVIETPIKPQQTSFDACLSLYGVAAVIIVASAKAGVPVVDVAMQSWRSAFRVATSAPKSITNQNARRKWVKQQTIDRCHQRGWAVVSDNEGDACGIWSWACDQEIERVSPKQKSIFEGLSI